MPFTRSTLVERARQMADTVGAVVEWPPALVLSLASVVHGHEWAQLLATNPFYRVGSRTVSVPSGGIIPFTTLDAGAPDALERVFRILEVRSLLSQEELRYISPEGVSSTATDDGTVRGFTVTGENMRVWGYPAGTSLGITVNHRPTRVEDLSADTAIVDFPDDGLLILACETGALMLDKGARESGEAGVLRSIAEVHRQKLYDTLARRVAAPRFIPSPDAAWEYGG